MKVEINSQALADAVAWTTRVIDARPATPILAGVRLEAIDGILQLSAFNYQVAPFREDLPINRRLDHDHHFRQVHLHHAADAG